MFKIMIVPVVFQALMIIHVIKTGRSTSWIYLLIFLPFAGGIAYLVVELIPSIFNRRRIDRTTESISDFLRPGSRLKKMEDQAIYSSTFKNVSALGDEYLDRGRFAEAAATYKSCLKPPFEKNDEYLYKLAFAYYKVSDFINADDTMKKISDIGMGRLKAQELLLRGKIYEGMERWEEAGKCYREASAKTGDLSYRLEYGLFLKRTGDIPGAETEFEAISSSYARLPKAFQKQYRETMNQLKRETESLRASGGMQDDSVAYSEE